MSISIATWFWNDDFWLPNGVSFSDFISTPKATYARPRDLFMLFVWGFVVFIVRHLFERYISNSIARRILSKDVEKIKLLNLHKNGHSHSNRVSTSNGISASSTADEKTKDRQRKYQHHLKSQMAKIAETSWKSLYHSFSFTYGMIILVQSPWFWDTKQCWIGYPTHELWPSLYYYYMIEGAYYIALLMCLATDVKRKDRGMMMVHHVATINLIFFSYALNQTRIGSLLMVLHRLADMMLQIAKLLLYCKQKAMANILFVIFVLTFLLTRIYIYPMYIVHTTLIKSRWFFEIHPWYLISNAIMISLQILHIMWAHIILKMAFKVVFKGPLDKDDRSGSEDDEITDENAKKKN